MAAAYGWTLDAIDALDEAQRQRVRYWWAVKTIHTRASQYLEEWQKKQGTATKMFGDFKSSGLVR